MFNDYDNNLNKTYFYRVIQKYSTMAKKTTSKKAKGKDTVDKATIMAAYINYVLNEDKVPNSVYKFCIDENISEESYYELFGSLESIRKSIWNAWNFWISSRNS